MLEWIDWSLSQPMPKILPGYRWQKVEERFDNNHGDRSNHGNLDFYCYEQKAPIVSLSSKVGVSIVHDGPVSYIAGLHIIYEDGTEMHLGYTSSNRVYTVVSGGVLGFIPDTGERGIYAIRFVDGNGFISPKLGYPNKGTRTMRLVFKSLIHALKVGSM